LLENISTKSCTQRKKWTGLDWTAVCPHTSVYFGCVAQKSTNQTNWKFS